MKSEMQTAFEEYADCAWCPVREGHYCDTGIDDLWRCWQAAWVYEKDSDD